MSQNHIQKFQTSMFEYCSNQAERAYKLLEDGEIDVSLSKLGHLADVLQLLISAKSDSTGLINISSFAQSVKELEENEKDEVYTHLQENGFGQYIAE